MMRSLFERLSALIIVMMQTPGAKNIENEGKEVNNLVSFCASALSIGTGWPKRSLLTNFDLST